MIGCFMIFSSKTPVSSREEREMKNELVTVFGGSGFIGRHLIKRLMDQGMIVRVAVRDVESALFLKPLGNAGRIVPFPADITNKASVARAVQGAGMAVNLVGVLYERGGATFKRVHVEGARNIAEAAAEAGVKRLVQVSAMGADENGAAKYARTKAVGERAVLKAFPDAVVLRPSVVFGPEDDFFNRFAFMAKTLHVLPVIGTPLVPKVKILDGRSLVSVDPYGDGGPKFQPVYVDDVAAAIVKGLIDPATSGKTYELAGPTVYSFKDIMGLVTRFTGCSCILMPLPLGFARFQSWFLQALPKPLLTPDQTRLLERDNVRSEGSLGLKELGVDPVAAEALLPTYLHRFKRTGKRRLGTGARN